MENMIIMFYANNNNLRFNTNEVDNPGTTENRPHRLSLAY